MSDDKQTTKATRRQFLKGAALVGVTGLTAGVAAGCSQATPAAPAQPAATAAPAAAPAATCPPAPTAAPAPTCPPAPTAAPVKSANVPDKWDYDVDVVVVGSGTAFVAAVVAGDAGLKTILLEKSKTFGGTTGVSGGGLWVPNNYLMQKAGVADSKEDAVTYLKKVAQGHASDELVTRYVEKAPEMVEWLRDHAGFGWKRAGGTFADYYTFPGYHKSQDTRQINVDRADKKGAGMAIALSAQEALKAKNVQVMLETPGKRLVVDDSGAVIGIIAESQGKEITIRTRRGVVLGTGGFDFNKDMVNQYLRGPIYFSVSVPGNTGDGHLMGIAAGADLGNMQSCWGLPGYVSKPDSYSGESDWQLYRGKPGAITVNKYGQRFMNEACAYHPAIGAFYTYDTGKFEYTNLPGYAIFDSSYTKNYPLPGSGFQVGKVPTWMTKADTLDDLAKALGIDPAGLKATVERFNENARNGVDPDYHRGEADFDQVTAGDKKRTDLKNPALAPIETGPFYGAAIWPGTCGTNGGLRTDLNGQVLNVWGKPITGLYATGNTMASPMGAGYPGGGGTVGAGMTFAYLAGLHLASLKS